MLDLRPEVSIRGLEPQRMILVAHGRAGNAVPFRFLDWFGRRSAFGRGRKPWGRGIFGGCDGRDRQEDEQPKRKNQGETRREAM